MPYIIGLGCSWTHGEGGWTEEIQKKYHYRVQHYKHGALLPLPEAEFDALVACEREHSWVNCLSKNHLPEYTPINLGAPGSGNDRAVKSLRDLTVTDLSGSIIIMMLSALDRYDLLMNNGWETGYPCEHLNDSESDDRKYFDYFYCYQMNEIQTVYKKTFYSLLELQDFAAVNDCKLVICNGWGTEDLANADTNSHLHSKINWDNWMHTDTAYGSFLEKLVELDGKVDDVESIWGVYDRLEKPSTYLTNCMGVHPTILGHQTIANEIANHLNDKYI